MPLRAILSDVHGNLEALRAVLSDARELGATEILCLGDMVGYGPDPVACVDLLRRASRVVLKGNHEEAVLSGDAGMKPDVQATIQAAREALQKGWRGRSRWNFFAHLPSTYREGDQLYVHASPRDPINEYMMPSDCRDLPEKLREIFKLVDHVAFVGHTHVPGIFSPEPSFRPAGQVPDGELLGRKKWIVNVGSVGQPRDRDRRACYVLFDGTSVRYRRVEYEFEKTQRKILAAGLASENHARRLAEGT
ncbi:MAG: metallophosphoesterase [Planctomycetes bacterium]|nr:metallophosphoesterase [Planctomycetota bacterium]